MRRTSKQVSVGIVVAALGISVAATAQDVDLRVYSDTAGRGKLVAVSEGGGAGELFRGVCAGGQCLFSATDPGFRSPTDVPVGSALHALPNGTRVSMEIVSIDDAASVKIGSNIADDPSETLLVGTVPLHVHPSWQAILPLDQARTLEIRFRLTAPRPFQESDVYSLQFTAGEVAVPTPTPTATVAATATLPPTATPPASVTASPSSTPTPTATLEASRTATATATPSMTVSLACGGDCDGDRAVTVDEIVTGIGIALGRDAVAVCPAFDGNLDAQVTVEEIVKAVNNALGGCQPG